MAIAWSERIGYQRDWIWRGWQIRYSFRPARLTDSSYPPLLLVHGFGAAIEHWRQNIPVLSHQHRVYAIDLLGFGGSRKVATTFSIELWGDLLADFCQTVIGEPVVLIGNSIGSAVCLSTAARYGDRVAGLVMANLPDVALRKEMIPSVLQTPVRAIENLFTAPFLLKPLFKILRQRRVLRWWAAIAYPHRHAISEELIEILAAPTLDAGAEQAFCALCQSVNEPQFAPSAKAILPRLQLPILLLWGKQDRMVPPSLAPVFAQLNPHIQLIELEDSGHCPHDETPAVFNRLLREWLTAHFPRDCQPQSLPKCNESDRLAMDF
jgi:pimeloyl-ACP methyl ester carboxylesterase